MPFTPVYGWPYQALTDAPDGANLGEDLALAIEATVNGLITGSIGGPIADLETDVAALEEEVRHYGCRLRRAAVQSIPNNTATTVTWDTEDEDTDGFWTPGSPTILTVPQNGTYAMSYFNALQATPNQNRNLISIYVTSSIAGAQGVGIPQFRSNFIQPETYISVTGVADLNAGDTISCDVYHQSGVAVNTLAWFSIHRVNTRT